MERDANSPSHGRKYKSRKERPCDACRRRKVCCIREPGDGACSLCRMQNSSCRYDKGPTSRRRRPASGPPVTEDAESSSSVFLRRHGSRDRRESLITTTTPGFSAATGGEWISQYVGLSGDQDPFVLRHSNFNRSNYYKSDDWACLRVRSDGAFPAIFTLVPDSHLDARPPHYPDSSLLDEAYPLHHELLTTYFDVIHTSYPLLDPTRFVKGNKIDLPLLAAMYSLSLPYCPAARDLSYGAINSFAFQALPIESRMPRLETIEASLLFLQRHTQIHRAPTTPGLYAELGALVGISHDAGLNIDPSSWDLSTADRSRRKRLWYAVFIADKWSALGLGRPSYIHDDECNVPLLTVDDIPAETVGKDGLPRTSSQMFVAIAALTQILSAILTTFYTLKGAEHSALSTVEELARVKGFFELQLHDFQARYMAPFANITDVFLDPTGTLFLAYYTVEIVLCRALLRCLPPTDPNCLQLRERARQLVMSISKLLENLQVTRLRAFWWSPISRINFAMAGGFMFSMLLSSVTDEEVEWWSAELSRYRRLLDMQSLAFDTTKLAAARMSALANVNQARAPSDATTGRVDPKQAFCRDFGVELNTL
ncbi:transcriptional regulatory [Lecanosticta acicola]|uniref:Transcriptional regulatory n=1 Tax=Lecanosticta acicola TaxID=111012 RepID=A0AAI8YYE4_9PEZI|nr:transcriptional regulatory [Lecanosticta acicola]